MILSDQSILDRIGLYDYDPLHARIEPFDENALQGASYDCHLADAIIAADGREHRLSEQDGYIIPPRGVCLAATCEYVHVPADCVLRVEGKSSIGRQFIIIHATAGWCDPGWHGRITLEIVNHHPTHHFALDFGMPIAQITFLQLDRQATRQYAGRYQGDMGVQGAKPYSGIIKGLLP